MPRVLLVDTNFSSAPIYNYLVKSGHEVFVVGGNPADYLARSVGNYVNQDYSDVAGMRKLLDRLAIDYLVPGCNDLSYQVCAELNADGGFQGIDDAGVAELINNKGKFREFASQAGLPVPSVISAADVGEVWPLIVKPVDAYSGRGMTVVSEPEKDSLQSAIDRAMEFSRSGDCIIEEYVEGQLYSHSAFLSNGGIVMDFIVEEHGTANPFVVDTSRVVYDFPANMLGSIRDNIALLASELGLADGLIHTQFIRNGQSYWLIEVTRRCPGDLYSRLIELSTGFKYAEAYAMPFVSQDIARSSDVPVQSWVMRHTISQPGEDFFGSIQFKVPLHIENFVPISLAGDIIKASPFGRVGIIFVRSRSKAELDNVYDQTLQRNLYAILQ